MLIATVKVPQPRSEYQPYPGFQVAASCGQPLKTNGMIRFVPLDADTPRHPWLAIRSQSAGQGTALQMYFAYSAIDRSLENLQERMTLSAAILAQSERFL